MAFLECKCTFYFAQIDSEMNHLFKPMCQLANKSFSAFGVSVALAEDTWFFICFRGNDRFENFCAIAKGYYGDYWRRMFIFFWFALTFEYFD